MSEQVNLELAKRLFEVWLSSPSHSDLPGSITDGELAAMAAAAQQWADEQNAELLKERRGLNEIVRHWQKFASKIAHKLGCFSQDDDIQKGVDKLRAENARLTEQRDRAVERLRPFALAHQLRELGIGAQATRQHCEEASAIVAAHDAGWPEEKERAK